MRNNSIYRISFYPPYVGAIVNLKLHKYEIFNIFGLK